MNEPHPDHPEPDTLRFECDLAEPRDKVWRALSDPALVARWMRPEATAGSPHGKDTPAETIIYRIIDAEPPHSIRYVWREGSELDSVVRFSLTETRNGGTRLTIVHSGLAAKAAPAVAMSGNFGCRMSLGQPSAVKPNFFPAHSPRMARAA